jgi:hypothetical protein
VSDQPVDSTSTATDTQPDPIGRESTVQVAVEPPPVPVDVMPPVATETTSRPQPAPTPAPEPADVVAKPVKSVPSVVTSAEPTPAQDLPLAIAEQPPEPVPEVVTTAAVPVPVQVDRVNPRVLRAGRNVTMRLEGAGLAAVSSVVINAGGVVDTRFRVGALEHSGDAALQFSLNVARGVPLGSYALVLRGADVRAEPILLEVSL